MKRITQKQAREMSDEWLADSFALHSVMEFKCDVAYSYLPPGHDAAADRLRSAYLKNASTLRDELLRRLAK